MRRHGLATIEREARRARKVQLFLRALRALRSPVLLVVALAATLAAGALTRLVAQQARFDASLYSGLRWPMIGPLRGGRHHGVSCVAGQPTTFSFGSVGGGGWRA